MPWHTTACFLRSLRGFIRTRKRLGSRPSSVVQRVSTLGRHSFTLMNRGILYGDRWLLSCRPSRRDHVDCCTGDVHLRPRRRDRGRSTWIWKDSLTVVVFVLDALYSLWHTTTLPSAFRSLGDSRRGYSHVFVALERYLARNSLSFPCLVSHRSSYLLLLWIPAFEGTTKTVANQYDEFAWTDRYQ